MPATSIGLSALVIEQLRTKVGRPIQVIGGAVVYLAWSCCVPRVYLARAAATYTGWSPGASAPPSAQAVALILGRRDHHNLSVDAGYNDFAVQA